ncbi:MAG: ABC transporter substrate-binding protein [Firmicutes bacterium]|nr:ABC transporter substrate-binding protein [Bacillota bacterium]
MDGTRASGRPRSGFGLRGGLRVGLRMIGLWALLALVVGAWLQGAPVFSAEGFPRTVIDGAGRAIILEAPPQRIFSVGLALDNILLTIADPARVVGVTRYAADPEWSYVADRVAEHMVLVDQLNAEQVLAAEPDIVLAAIWNNPDVVRQLEDLGVTIYLFTDFGTVAGTLDNIRRIGEITGEDERAQALIDEFHRRYGRLAMAIAGRPRPRVLSLDASWGTVGPGMTIHDIIELAGGINAAAEAGVRGWQTIDAEAVIRLNPDVIITPSGESWAARLRADPVLEAVPAVRAGRVYAVDHLEALNHHFILAIEQLAAILHGEALGN